MPYLGLVPLETMLGPLAPEHYSEFIVGVVLAVLVAVGVTKIVVPMFETLYEERAAEIEGSINQAQVLRTEAEEAKRHYLEQLAGSRADSAKAREEARAQAAAIINDAKAQAQVEQAHIMEQTNKQIEVERTQAMVDLQSDVGMLATQLAERILGESLSDSEVASRTIDRFLAELAEQPTRTAPESPAELGV